MTMVLDPVTKKALFRFKKLEDDAKQGIRMGLYRAGQIFKKTANEGILRSKKTGRKYKYKGKRYTASAVGEYPANRSGKNRRSISFYVRGFDRLVYGAGEKYSPYVEASRPFLIRSARESAQEARQAMLTELNRSFKR